MRWMRHQLDFLAAIEGIQSYQLVKDRQPFAPGIDALLVLQTAVGMYHFQVIAYRSHLTHRVADHILARSAHHGVSPDVPVLVLAPHIGAGLAARFAAAGVNYVDAHGNCHLSAQLLHIHIEGRTARPRPRADKGLRRAGYQALFAYLAEPSLLDASVRAVAEVAGVSRQPVLDMRHRLLDGEYVLKTGSKLRWHPRRREDALSMWLHGYQTAVRAAMVQGIYRTRERDPDELEEQLVGDVATMDGPEMCELRWGGSAAGYRLTRHFRGERTVVHVRPDPGDLCKRLQARPDPSGNLVVMDAFGTINWQGEGDTVHPLLVYSEMLHEGSERAREAARELFDTQLAPRWEWSGDDSGHAEVPG